MFLLCFPSISCWNLILNNSWSLLLISLPPPPRGAVQFLLQFLNNLLRNFWSMSKGKRVLLGPSKDLATHNFLDLFAASFSLIFLGFSNSVTGKRRCGMRRGPLATPWDELFLHLPRSFSLLWRARDNEEWREPLAPPQRTCVCHHLFLASARRAISRDQKGLLKWERSDFHSIFVATFLGLTAVFAMPSFYHGCERDCSIVRWIFVLKRPNANERYFEKSRNNRLAFIFHHCKSGLNDGPVLQ